MSAAATETLTPPQSATSQRPTWETIGNYVVLLVYSGIVLFTVRYHEKWGDEAQAWLVARDLDLKTLWFHELRYEGSPGLWHTILWFAQRVFHAPYSSIGYIGVGFAIAGAAVLIFKAPFPWFVRWPLAFTYFLVYQYAVIARTYTLLPLLCFAVAILFKDKERPWRMTLVLVFLANLSVHGALLTACFGLLYLVEAVRAWPQMSEGLRNQYFICAAVMVFTFLFLFIILKPTPDVEEFAMKKEYASLSEAEKQPIQMPTPWKKVTNILPGALLDYFIPSAIFLMLTTAWCYTRRRLLIFVLPVGLMIALYALIHGAPHHHGTVFIAVVTGLWIAWPTDEERASFSVRESWSMRGMVILLGCLCLVNIWDAAVVIKREYLYPYSGAEDAAKYLKSVGADHKPMFGLLWGVVGVQAYFDSKLFANTPTRYFHHGMPLRGRYLDVTELEQLKPEYVVVYTQDPVMTLQFVIPELTSRGYEIVHFSDGYYLYKQAVANREVYFILRRTAP